MIDCLIDWLIILVIEVLELLFTSRATKPNWCEASEFGGNPSSFLSGSIARRCRYAAPGDPDTFYNAERR